MRALTIARYHRLKAGYATARKLADLSGIRYVRYALWEGGQRRHYLDQDELAKVAELLGVPVPCFADKRGAPLLMTEACHD